MTLPMCVHRQAEIAKATDRVEAAWRLVYERQAESARAGAAYQAAKDREREAREAAADAGAMLHDLEAYVWDGDVTS